MQRLVLFLLLQASSALSLPELRFESPPELEAVRQRFEALPSSELSGVLRLIGPGSDTAPIRIELAPESSNIAQRVSPWIAGIAQGRDRVVIFPSRSPAYPHGTLDDVLRHEVAHILIAREASREAVPRWFNEGLAMAAERNWRFRDQTQLLYELVSGTQESLAGLDRLFEGGREQQDRAYLLSGALVRGLLDAHGDQTGAQILDRMSRGQTFDAAFLDVTGARPFEAGADFWRRRRVWTNWLPILFSEEMLWAAITLLAILAILRRRRKNAEIERRWAEEEREEKARRLNGAYHDED